MNLLAILGLEKLRRKLFQVQNCKSPKFFSIGAWIRIWLDYVTPKRLRGCRRTNVANAVRSGRKLTISCIRCVNRRLLLQRICDGRIWDRRVRCDRAAETPGRESVPENSERRSDHPPCQRNGEAPMARRHLIGGD